MMHWMWLLLRPLALCHCSCCCRRYCCCCCCWQQLPTATLYNALRCVLHSGCASQGRVVSGHNDALDVVAAAAGQLGALKVARLAVSGAFHTPLMEPAREALMQVLSAVEIRAPRIPVLSNVTAGPFPSDPAAIRELLGRQLVEPVRYEGCFACVLGGGGEGVTVPHMFPCCPM
jgi:hypothetical protein